MKTRKWLAYPYLVWMVGFIVVPLILIVYYGLTSAGGGITLDNIALISKPINRGALWLSLELSFISTIVCLVLAYPLALILRNLKIKSSSFVVLVFILPMWMNSLLRTLAWQNILENTGILNQILSFFNLPTLSIINTPSAIMIGMVYNFLPFMILPIYNSLVKISDDIVNAAKDLGANNFQTFIRVIWPLSFPGVVSGVIMVFVPSLTTFAISDILGGSKVLLIGNVIEQQFKIVNNWHTGSGLSLVLMVFILISMAILAKYDKNENKAGGQII
ncbi:MAG: ABC transporter permease [Clostridiales bacterium]|nr:ABC transporter permease [Clostridiales bacterium]